MKLTIMYYDHFADETTMKVETATHTGEANVTFDEHGDVIVKAINLRPNEDLERSQKEMVAKAVIKVMNKAQAEKHSIETLNDALSQYGDEGIQV